MRIRFRCAALLGSASIAGACARTAAAPAANADRQAFRGFYSMGPSLSAFRVCGSDEDWYVNPSTASAALELQRGTRRVQDQAPPGGMRTGAPAGADAGGFYRAYAEVEGDTLALSAGPEVGRYVTELRPTRVLIVRHFPRGECP